MSMRLQHPCITQNLVCKHEECVKNVLNWHFYHVKFQFSVLNWSTRIAWIPTHLRNNFIHDDTMFRKLFFCYDFLPMLSWIFCGLMWRGSIECKIKFSLHIFFYCCEIRFCRCLQRNSSKFLKIDFWCFSYPLGHFLFQYSQYFSRA